MGLIIKNGKVYAGSSGELITVDTELNATSTNPVTNAAVTNEISTVKDLTQAIDEDLANLETKVTVNTDAITTLNADETVSGSVKKTVVDEIAKVVAEAPEDFDTLKEMSDWIASHENDATAMNSAITQNTSDITGLQTQVDALPKIDDTTASTTSLYSSTKVELLTPTYTYIVDSNQALEDWANNVSGNNYTHVLIKAGTWNLTADTINLTTTGTISITGEAGNLIIHDLTYEGIMYTLQYDTVPTSNVYSINGVNIKTLNRITQTGTSTPPARGCVSFYKCTNLINCSAKGYTAYPVTGSNFFKGYSYCERLTNCYATIDKDTITSTNGFFAGFDYCKHLTNCRAYYKGSSSSHFVNYGFYWCDYISGCDVYVSGSSQQSNGYYKCNYISGSYAYCSSNSGAYSFSNCNYVTSCYGSSSSNAGTGVVSCNYMSNCKVYSIGSSMTGYKSCKYLDNCVYSTSALNNGVVGFSTCYGVRYCFVEVTGATGSTTATCSAYPNSYANLTANDTYACADSANGGWNTQSVATS